MRGHLKHGDLGDPMMQLELRGISVGFSLEDYVP